MTVLLTGELQIGAGNVDKVTLEWWIAHAGNLEEERDKWRHQALEAENKIKHLSSEVERLSAENARIV